MRFKVHVYGILLRKGWHYSCSYDSLDCLLLFFNCHKMQHYDKRLTHRLYRVHDNLDNKDTFFIIDFEELSYKHNKVKIVDREIAECYILEV